LIQRDTPQGDILHQAQGLSLADANEAETRLKIIDRVLFEVLDWTHDDVHVEEHMEESGTYADYIVRTVSSSFVLEAKRIGASPLIVPADRRVRLNRTFLTGDVGAAVAQAKKYASEKSIPFAIVTNGDQWIVFPATRTDQVTFAESTAIVFPSLQSVLGEDSLEFRELLSRDAVIGGSLELALLGRASNRLEDRRLGFYFTNRGRAPRENPLYPVLQEGIERAFGEVFSDTNAELLDKCYVRTPERRRYDSQLKMKIGQSRALFHRHQIQPMQRKEAAIVSTRIIESGYQPRPLAFLLLGRVGAGKTTFIKYTKLISCREFFGRPDSTQPGPHWIDIDFRGFPPEGSASDFFHQKLHDYIARDNFLNDYDLCLKHAYADEIIAMRRGPLKLLSAERADDKIADFLLGRYGTAEDAEKRLRYAATIAPIFVAVDNVDQIEDESIQSRVFAAAIAIAHSCNLNIVVSIRESTFVAHRSTPTFDAFDFTPVAIEPPQIAAVLSKRFALAREILSNRHGSFVAENGARVEVDDCGRLVELIASSVLGTSVGEVIEVLAQNDVRLALRLTREFLASGYSDPGRAWVTYQRKGRYVMPRHEALRAILLGNSDTYSEVKSSVGNPFDSKLGRGDLQLLRLFVLYGLVRLAERAEFTYLDGAELRSVMKRLGVDDRSLLEVVSDLVKHRFLYTAAHGEASLTSSFYPSRLGGYVVKRLLADFTFLEAMMMDTFIASRESWEQLKKLSETVEGSGNVVGRIEARGERVLAFFDYLRVEYEKLSAQANGRALPVEWLGNPFSAMAETLTRNVAKTRASAERNYG
jgi:hypothetical protein